MNPDNPSVLRPQVGCAAHELPLTPDDAAYFGDGLDDAVRELVLTDQLKPRHGRMYWAGRGSPARRSGCDPDRVSSTSSSRTAAT